MAEPGPTGTPELAARIGDLYAAFNARDVDSVLAALTDDVRWANGWEGGEVVGHAAVRDYWARQWAVVDPRVEPRTVGVSPDGRVDVTVGQTVRDLDGNVLDSREVHHLYTVRENLFARMEIV
ncbi:nuclear transport factor 2 family protein [Pseudofrankia sp. BMG5.36]|uniref:nuclear transport factor 2 family protein n=1 Tax=Pseudofrankia sp. BMG5.36 TaxID=1834512 RepID=UPI0018E3C5FA|nr:nuclear transport factor 2 family protein [Pseudofrankia sp. BMG5.36]